ncbi:VOC family protein [Candidatus Parcubacteria bacterium]|nr:VOC family protein [Candidatus Parcubacteria bacterium]
MDPVVHFELPYEDNGRMVGFYSEVFGWEANQLGKEMGNYVVVTTTQTDENRMVKKPGTINGGFYQKSKDGASPVIVVAVEDIREAMKKVEAAGGKVLGGAHKAGEPDDIPGVGLYCGIIDTEGNKIAMLQPKNM